MQFLCENLSLLTWPNCKVKDKSNAQLVKYLETRDLLGTSSHDRTLIPEVDQHVLQDGILYHLYSPTAPFRRQETHCQLVIPRNLIDEVLASMHDDIKCRSFRRS